MPQRVGKATERRPLGFSVLLILLIVACTAGVTTASTHREEWLASFANMTPALFWVWIGCGIVNIISCLGMWMWRKWGFVLTLQNFALTAGLELYFSPPFGHVIRLPVVLALIIYFYRPHRARFV
ncbi:MAG: hypothetical protein HY286_00600 [Planctomycetes bacterium]|nr:hypothetical protein [Planctomycetota bacterium]